MEVGGKGMTEKEIVERLKKRIEEITKEVKKANPEYLGVTTMILEELQKILGEE